MQAANKPKGSFTIFHVWWVLAVLMGLGCGIGYGAVHFGWLGGVAGGVVGFIVGVVAGWLPWFLAFMFLSHLGARRERTEKIGP